jgi:STE24 endopeptidase
MVTIPLIVSAAQPPIHSDQTVSHELSQKSPEREQLEPVAVPEPSALAMQFYRSSNWLWALNVALAVLLPGVLAFSGFSTRLRNAATMLGRTWFFTIGLYVVMYLAVVFLLELPVAYYEGYVRLHAFGLSNQSLQKWFGDSVIRRAISMAVGFALAWVPYLLMARSPKRWWVYTTLLSIPFLFAGMLIKPIWIDPLFNRFGPMKNQALEEKILALAARSGIAGSRVFEVEKSVDTNAVNAYVTGVFATKRIVLWDTLLAKLDEKEVLHVMGHEMGHYVLGHVVRSIVLSSVLTLIGLFLVDWCARRLVARYSDRLGFDRLSDVASVPLLLMLLEVAMLLLSPVALAYSRMQEHEADRYALERTHDNHAGAHSFLKLMEENLSNPRPGPIYKFFRSSHPSIGERIDFCNSYRPWLQVGRPPADSRKELPHGPPRSH